MLWVFHIQCYLDWPLWRSINTACEISIDHTHAFQIWYFKSSTGWIGKQNMNRDHQNSSPHTYLFSIIKSHSSDCPHKSLYWSLVTTTPLHSFAKFNTHLKQYKPIHWILLLRTKPLMVESVSNQLQMKCSGVPFLPLFIHTQSDSTIMHRDNVRIVVFRLLFIHILNSHIWLSGNVRIVVFRSFIIYSNSELSHTWLSSRDAMWVEKPAYNSYETSLLGVKPWTLYSKWLGLTALQTRPLIL